MIGTGIVGWWWDGRCGLLDNERWPLTLNYTASNQRHDGRPGWQVVFETVASILDGADGIVDTHRDSAVAHTRAASNGSSSVVAPQMLNVDVS